MAKTFGDRWKVTRQLPEGGQAFTYVVEDTSKQYPEEAVLKLLKNRKRIARFAEEIRALKKVEHPGIVRIVDDALGGDNPFFVMELCSGTLDDDPERWGRDPVATLHLFAAICDAVAVAHVSGITAHRDLKPSNILLRTPEGPPVVADFGLCILNDAPERFTERDEAVGPRLFMAPELEDGRAAEGGSNRSDCYSLGKLLYWMLSGGRIFSREKHRDEWWDLTRSPDGSGQENEAMAHVYRWLLDPMIVADPNERLFSAAQARGAALEAARLIAGGFAPLTRKVRIRCRFCGRGHYQVRAEDSERVADVLGVRPISGQHWRILACTQCGHLQLFRKDFATAGGWDD